MALQNGLQKENRVLAFCLGRFFKAGFYFLERHLQGIGELEIDPGLKDALSKATPFGTLYPVTLEMRKTEQIGDLLCLIEYKKKLK